MSELYPESPESAARTFDELMLIYLEGVGREKSSHERDSYSAKRLYPHFTKRELHTLSGADIRAYIDARRSAGASPKTVNRELGLLSSALNFARRELDWDVPNPAQGRRLREPEGRVRRISPDEAKRLIAAAESEPQAPYLADFIRLALNAGCRRDELRRLEWGRVDRTARLLHPEASPTKAGKRRSIPLNALALDALAARRAWCDRHCLSTAWVFAKENGERVQSIKRSWATACRRAGIEDFRVQTCATPVPHGWSAQASRSRPSATCSDTAR